VPAKIAAGKPPIHEEAGGRRPAGSATGISRRQPRMLPSWLRDIDITDVIFAKAPAALHAGLEAEHTNDCSDQHHKQRRA